VIPSTRLYEGIHDGGAAQGGLFAQAGVFCVVINPSFVIGECMTKVRAL
jgi:hypothetical protein